ncbi:MAG TPA: hypothetical protein VMU54_02870 [Planctomycetota bacterium]|nr:hypothetical protein [Planctomycetota bacterium]
MPKMKGAVMNPTFARRSERGMSLISMLVIVVIVGGISAAFFLLSITQRQQSDLVQYRTKSYYIGESAVEMVAGMLKKAASAGILPPNPVINASSNPPWDTGLNGGTGAPFSLLGLTSQWEWWYLPPTSGAVWKLPSVTEEGTAAASGNSACVQLRLHGNVVINDGIAPETFAYTIINFQNTAGGGVGNTGVKNFYSVTVDGRVQHFETAGTKALGTRGTHVKITREMELNNQSLLPFFAFYNGTLEFLPGPPFVGNGKIHTNSDLFIAGAGGMDLNTDYIGAAGFIYRHRLDNGSYTQNSNFLNIHPPYSGTPPFGAANPAGSVGWSTSLESGIYSPGPPPSEAPNSSWASGAAAAGLLPTVQSGASRMDTPPISSIQPPPATGGPGGNYYEWAKNPTASSGSVAAGLIVSVDATGTMTATYNSGSGPVDVTSALQSSGAITSSTIADNRQSQTTSAQTTVIDMGKLRSSGYLPKGGILYTTDARNGLPTRDTSGNLVPPVPPTGTPPAGFVFQNGKDLSTNTNPNIDAINIVSNGPVYVKGDFNAPVSGETDPVTGLQYQKVNAAIIADAVNMLSNAWNNSKVPGGAPPTASATTYNFALVTGNVPTNGTQYSGGLENLPRFHENWSGVANNYRGSLINLWTSAIAKGAWGQNNVYSPPNRNWDWDSSFGAGGTKIPGFPSAVSLSRTIYITDYWGAGGASGASASSAYKAPE